MPRIQQPLRRQLNRPAARRRHIRRNLLYRYRVWLPLDIHHRAADVRALARRQALGRRQLHRQRRERLRRNHLAPRNRMVVLRPVKLQLHLILALSPQRRQRSGIVGIARNRVAQLAVVVQHISPRLARPVRHDGANLHIRGRHPRRAVRYERHQVNPLVIRHRVKRHEVHAQRMLGIVPRRYEPFPAANIHRPLARRRIHQRPHDHMRRLYHA